MEREEKADREVNTTAANLSQGTDSQNPDSKPRDQISRPRSRRRTVTDAGQSNNRDQIVPHEDTPASELQPKQTPSERHHVVTTTDGHLSPPIITTMAHENADQQDAPLPNDPMRPSAGGQAFPFKLGTHVKDDGRSASVTTLTSHAGVVSPKPSEINEFPGLKHGEQEGIESEPTYPRPGAATLNMNNESTNVMNGNDEGKQRPHIERFETASEGV